MKKRMGCKACDESKPQQPKGCEDLDEEYNEADRLLFILLCLLSLRLDKQRTK